MRQKKQKKTKGGSGGGSSDHGGSSDAELEEGMDAEAKFGGGTKWIKGKTSCGVRADGTVRHHPIARMTTLKSA